MLVTDAANGSGVRYDCCRYIIGIAGPPGGGKSTLAILVRDTINSLAAEASDAGEEPAVMVPMDGDDGPISSIGHQGCYRVL